MARYPGQQRRRWPIVMLGGVVAVAAGLVAGWLVSGRASGTPAVHAPVCPGGSDDAGRQAAAACLVRSYYALENEAPAVRDARLADLISADRLASARGSYQALGPKVSAEYAAVAATHIVASPSRPRTEATGQAWVAFVDDFTDGSPPLAQWWITGFDLQWRDGRWWLDGGVTTQVDATPRTSGAAPRSGFGPGWVAAGA